MLALLRKYSFPIVVVTAFTAVAMLICQVWNLIPWRISQTVFILCGALIITMLFTIGGSRRSDGTVKK